MEPDTNKPDLETIKNEAGKLFSDVASWMKGASADAQKKFEEARPGLEEKLAAAKAEAERLGGATAGAANDMGKGFMSAFEELKSAFGDAQKHFRKEDEAPATETAEKEEKDAQ